MWTPVRIEMVNLFSHPHSTYDFKTGACTVIFGRNLSDRALDNNGAGKTTLFEAVCIALTGDSLRKIDKEVFINDGANFCDIILELKNAVLRQTLRIERHFYRGSKSSRVELYENDSLNTQMTSVLECNKRILDLLGISREDLLRYYIISQDNHYTFFSASDGEKKEIMNRITSADLVLPIMDEIDRRSSALQEKRTTIQRDIDKLEERRNTLSEQAEELVSDVADDGGAYMELIEQANIYERGAKQYEEEAIQLEKEHADALKNLEEIKCDESRVREWDEKIRKKRKSIDETEEQLAECGRIKREIDVYLSGEVVCPKCGERFVPKSDTELTLEQIDELKAETEQQEQQLNHLLNKQKENLKGLKEKRSIAEQELEVYQKAERAARSIENKIQDKRINAKRYKTFAEKARSDAKAIAEDKTRENQLKELNKKIAEAEKGLELKQKELKPFEDEISMLKFWKYNMGRGGFQTYLANKSVKVIEGITNSYLERFGVDIRVSISGFKVLKSGDVREKIDVFVSNNGIEWKPFMGKSGGERGRVTLAGVLGIQRLINLSTGGRGLDLLLFDESFPGMDSRGQENIIKVFEKMGSTIMVITQDVSEGFNNENTLIVVKEGGESRYL